MSPLNRIQLSLLALATSPTIALADGLAPSEGEVPDLDHVGNFISKVHGSGHDLQNILVPFGVFAMVIALVWIRHRSEERVTQLNLEAVKILAEKGQPIPEGLLRLNPRRPKNPMSSAITLVAIGTAFLCYNLVTDPKGGEWAIGVGFLIAGVGRFWLAKKSQAPQS